MAMVACRPVAWLARVERIAPGPQRAEPSASAIVPAAADPAELPTPSVSAGAAPPGALPRGRAFAGAGDAGAAAGGATTAGSTAADVATTAGGPEVPRAVPPDVGDVWAAGVGLAATRAAAAGV